MNKSISQWDQRYNRSDYYYGVEPNSFLTDQRDLFFKDAKVLCLAEGEGRNAVFLAKLGCDVTAVDSSQVGLDKLEKLATQSGVSVNTICCDLNEFVFEENRWNFIVSIWCHLPSALRMKIHRRSVRSLDKEGFFILEAYTPNQLKFKTGGPQDPDMMPTPGALKSELDGLTLKVLQEIERNISEGIGHQGMSAVVQVIAKKENAHAKVI
jgi:hypothetical protein